MLVPETTLLSAFAVFACQFLCTDRCLILLWVLHGYIVSCIRTEPGERSAWGVVFFN